MFFRLSKVSLLLLLSLTISVLGISVSLYMYYTKPKIGYVYNNKILTEYKGTKASQALFEKKRLQWNQQADTLEKEFIAEVKKFRNEEASLSSSLKETRQQFLKEKQRQVMEFRKSIQEKIQREDGNLSGNVASEIDNYMARYGKEHGFTYIFGVNSQGNIFYANDADDLTLEILNGLNQMYK